MKIPNFSFLLLKYCQDPLFWLLTLGGPVGHNINLRSEFLLGTEKEAVLRVYLRFGVNGRMIALIEALLNAIHAF